MAENRPVKVGDIYEPGGNLRKNQVVTQIDEDASINKAPIWKRGSKTFVGIVGGGDLDEVGKVIGNMSIDEICEGYRNFLDQRGGDKKYIDKVVEEFRKKLDLQQ